LLSGVIEYIVDSNKVRSRPNRDCIRLGIERGGVKLIQLDVNGIDYSRKAGLNAVATSGDEERNVVDVCSFYLIDSISIS
jgi:hypothetical protein